MKNIIKLECAIKDAIKNGYNICWIHNEKYRYSNNIYWFKMDNFTFTYNFLDKTSIIESSIYFRDKEYPSGFRNENDTKILINVLIAYFNDYSYFS